MKQFYTEADLEMHENETDHGVRAIIQKLYDDAHVAIHNEWDTISSEENNGRFVIKVNLCHQERGIVNRVTIDTWLDSDNVQMFDVDVEEGE